MYKRCHPLRDPELRRWWAIERERCMACGILRHQSFMGLQTHHLIKFGRSDEYCNLLALCPRCHMAAEEGCYGRPSLSLAHCLWLKRHHDPENWQPERLAELRGQPLPELEEPPDWYLHRLGLLKGGNHVKTISPR